MRPSRTRIRLTPAHESPCSGPHTSLSPRSPWAMMLSGSKWMPGKVAICVQSATASLLAFVARAVGYGLRVLDDAVVGHELGQCVRIMLEEDLVEAVQKLFRSARSRRLRNYHMPSLISSAAQRNLFLQIMCDMVQNPVSRSCADMSRHARAFRLRCPRISARAAVCAIVTRPAAPDRESRRCS